VHLYRFGFFYMASDDSYIYLGYVRNWVEHGELLTYNPGEHSAGTTGLLYYYLLSAVASVLRFVYWPNPGIGLTLVAYLTNALLFISLGLLTARIWYYISEARERLLSHAGIIVVLAATVSLPSFLWGWFGGLENPLSGTVLLLIIERVLAKAQGWKIALACALLGGCRPELLPVGLLVVFLWAAIQVIEQRSLRMPGPQLIASVAAFVGMTLLIYLPCWFATGSITPSALGTRVAIPALTEPNLLWQNLIVAARSGYFIRPWVASVPLLFVGLLTVRRTYANWVLISATSILAIYFLMRGALGITDFNVQDRYVSFLWPLYVLIAGHVLQQILIRFGLDAPTIRYRRFAFAATALLMSGFVCVGFTEANNELSADVIEMNQVSVLPSKWMAEHLPKSARVIMEPAGAIRVFTDFYLIDAVGLTTRHVPDYLASTTQPSYVQFLQKTMATHIFDYPGKVPLLSNRSLFHPLGFWTPTPRRFSLGIIGVYAIAPAGLAE
jgi:hypothetical protein